MLKASQAAFAVACFWGLSDVHECSGHLQMAAYPFDKQTAGCNSSHDWLMSLAMDLTAHYKPRMETEMEWNETKWNDVEQMKYIHTSLSSFLFVLYTEMFKSDGLSLWL